MPRQGDLQKRRPAYRLDMQAFLRRALVLGALMIASLAGSGSLLAQEPDADLGAEARAERLTLGDGLIEVERPTGWSFVPPGPKALATLRSDSDAQAQIEVRSSDGVTATRWDTYQRTFDTELQQVGFVVHQVRANTRFGGRSGPLREYELEVEELSYRLLLWHTHHDDRAWVFAIFSLTTRRDAHFKSFEEFLNEVEWGDAPPVEGGDERR